jgi:DNA-binding NtrC family response regulator
MDKTSLMSSPEMPNLVGNSPAISAVRQEIAKAARTQAKVLILGETGVGKEVVARLIHAQGSRRNRAFMAVNCSGIPETLLESELFGHVRGSFTGAFRDKTGLVQQADSGSLFLDELGEMSLRMQAVLLRFAETGELQRIGAEGGLIRSDVRLITATNRDLRAQIESGAFRADLFYRLNVIQIQVPPLRDRGDDILLLMEHYLERAAQAHSVPIPTLTVEAAQLLMAYRWPGNVRELRNLAERLVLHEQPHALAPADLPAEIRREPRSVATAAPSPVHDAADAAAPAPGTLERVQRLWDQLQTGENFWAVVYQPFKARELTRADLAALIDRGLRHTHGSYRALLHVFHLQPTEYKRFHAFLYQQECNLPVAPYRRLRTFASAPRRSRNIAAAV